MWCKILKYLEADAKLIKVLFKLKSQYIRVKVHILTQFYPRSFFFFFWLNGIQCNCYFYNENYI